MRKRLRPGVSCQPERSLEGIPGRYLLANGPGGGRARRRDLRAGEDARDAHDRTRLRCASVSDGPGVSRPPRRSALCAASSVPASRVGASVHAPASVAKASATPTPRRTSERIRAPRLESVDPSIDFPLLAHAKHVVPDPAACIAARVTADPSRSDAQSMKARSSGEMTCTRAHLPRAEENPADRAKSSAMTANSATKLRTCRAPRAPRARSGGPASARGCRAAACRASPVGRG